MINPMRYFPALGLLFRFWTRGAPGSLPMAADASSDLLFGLLALQNGLIDQGALVAAFQAWTRDRSRPLADHLEARNELDPEDRRAVEALVARHLKKHGGDPKKSLAALALGPSTRENLARTGGPDVVASLAHVGSGSGSSADADRTATYDFTAAPSISHRFSVLRPHAKGGLGEVFVAFDQELHREVALKQIQEPYADDPASRSRFLREAQITGGLEHPGIVPVYGLQHDADGRPFYAMRLVRGESFRDAIRRFHAPEQSGREPGERALGFRRLLGQFIAVCNATAYAHSRGVIHRDLKPSNILLGPYGETLVVDWGLAKVVGRGSESLDATESTLRPSPPGLASETQPGSVLGTPAYMSPEQAAGRLDQMGPASDVFSLGSILYTILTGQTPFRGDTVAEVLLRVQEGRFLPPSARGPSVDMAQESVCLRAMALRPEDRYASPRVLADEIETWLASDFERLQVAHRELQSTHEELKRTQGRLFQSEKLAALGMLSAGVAHEINTPLSYVLNDLVVLQREVKGMLDMVQLYERARRALEPPAQQSFQRIDDFAEEIDWPYVRDNLDPMIERTRNGAKRIASIIDNLRGFSRLDPPVVEQVDINEPLTSALEMIRGRLHRSHISVEEEKGELPLVSADPRQINQVFLNLLVNAMQAIEATHREDGRIIIRTQCDTKDVVIEIVDNGCGIPAEFLYQIFDPFFTTKSVGDGTGLGLSITHGIVQDHDGRIEVESTPSQGSCFRVFLPVVKAPLDRQP